MDFRTMTELTEAEIQVMNANQLVDVIDTVQYNLDHQPHLDMQTVWDSNKVIRLAQRYLQAIHLETENQLARMIMGEG